MIMVFVPLFMSYHDIYYFYLSKKPSYLVELVLEELIALCIHWSFEVGYLGGLGKISAM